jgi:hypothetical protein
VTAKAVAFSIHPLTSAHRPSCHDAAAPAYLVAVKVSSIDTVRAYLVLSPVEKLVL